MRTFRTLWFLILALAAVVAGLARHIIADALGMPQPPGQYIIGGAAIALGALALAPMFLFRRR